MSVHVEVACEKVPNTTIWHKRSTQRGGYWKSQYRCPCCGRETNQIVNFLGGHTLTCDGVVFMKRRKS